MVKGLLADINTIGYVEALVARMQAEPWADFWDALGLVLFHFEDFGLTDKSRDLEIWQTCQSEQLILITDNRNEDDSFSLEATIRRLNQAESLPVFTVSDLDRFRNSRSFAEQVVESLYDYLLRIDEVRGCGRLYLP